MLRFLIYGHGWIGEQFVDLLGKYEYIIGQSRVDNDNDLATEIDKIAPTHVICLIGRTHGRGFSTIDYLEQSGKIYENVRDNLYAPISLAALCKERGIHLTYMGTGCIFEYDEDHPQGDQRCGFKESDTPNFTGSAYSTVKGFTDRLMHTLFDDCVLNVRIRMPITDMHHPRNFITKITTYDKICSIPNSMTVLPELLPLMIDMAVRKVTGTINLVNPGVISHNEILELYQSIVDPTFSWENFTPEEQSKVLAGGRSNNSLDTRRLQTLYPDVLPIRESVINVLRQMVLK